MLQITPSYINEFGQLAAHCDKDKLNIAVREAKLFDMKRLFGNFWYEIDNNSDSLEPKWRELIDGSTFECNGKTREQVGVKQVLAYYSYARYVVLNGFSDTPNGHVTKDSSYSIPKSLDELEKFSIKYRDMGYSLFEDVRDFVCVNRGNYDGFRGDCQACGCDEAENDRNHKNTTGIGFRSKTIKKWDV